MLLAFRDARLRDICVEPETAQRIFGAAVAAALRARVADLRAARVASELLPPVQLDSGPPAALLVGLMDKHVMRWTVNHDPVPMAGSGVDWDRVRRVQLQSIEEAA